MQLAEAGPAMVLWLPRTWPEGAAAGKSVRASAQAWRGASLKDFRFCLLHPALS